MVLIFFYSKFGSLFFVIIANFFFRSIIRKSIHTVRRWNKKRKISFNVQLNLLTYNFFMATAALSTSNYRTTSLSICQSSAIHDIAETFVILFCYFVLMKLIGFKFKIYSFFFLLKFYNLSLSEQLNRGTPWYHLEAQEKKFFYGKES